MTGSRAVVVATARTPIGRSHKGSLVAARPDDLAAFAIRAVLEQVPELPLDVIDDVIIGCGFPERKQGMNLGRRAALLAGLPASVPGTTVNRFCASSLQAIRTAFHAIQAGEGRAFVAAGVESISQVNGYPRDDDAHPRLRGGDDAVANAYVPMGITAENVAARYGVSREEMDRYSQQSHERALAARASGFSAREIEPYELPDGAVVTTDDGPRPTSSLEALSALKPAFLDDGKVTAGNACPLNDGAAAVVVMDEQYAASLGIRSRARLLASGVSGISPN